MYVIKANELNGKKVEKIVNKLRKSRADWNVKKFMRMFADGELGFDNALQRGLVWDKERKSLFIHTLIREFPVYEITVQDGIVYDVLDGKQRVLGTILDFVNDGFELEGIPNLVVIVDGEQVELDINGLKFSELPDIIKEAIEGFNIGVIILDAETEEEDINEMFFRLNNYKPMSAIDLTRAKAKSQKKIFEMAQHPLFTKSLTAKALESRKPEDIVTKMHIILNYDNVNFDAKTIRSIMMEMEITDEDQAKITQIIDRMQEIHEIILNRDCPDKKAKTFQEKKAKRVVTHLHMISSTPIIWRTIEKGLTANQAANWFEEFYGGTKKASIMALYNDACSGGTGKKESVKRRRQELDKHFNSWLKKLHAAESKKEEEMANAQSGAAVVEITHANIPCENANPETEQTAEEVEIVTGEVIETEEVVKEQEIA